jgi:hypothetical protein
LADSGSVTPSTADCTIASCSTFSHPSIGSSIGNGGTEPKDRP